MTHVIAFEVRRFYRVCVEDEGRKLTNEQAVEEAVRRFENDPGIAEEVIEVNVEPDDLIWAGYDYNFD